MKRTYIKFAAAHSAPKIQTRRMGLKPFVTAAYKSDGETDTDDELKTEVKAISKNVKMAVDNTGELKTKLENTQIELKSAQAELTSTKTALETTQTEVKEVKAALVVKDERDVKNQEAINKLIAERKNNPGGVAEVKTFQSVLKDEFDKNQDQIEKFQRKELKSFAIEVKAVGDITTGNVTGGSRYGALNRVGIIENPKRKTHVRDLMQTAQLGPGTSYTFMRENGTGEGDPAPTAETATKPQFDMDLVENTVQIETIAGWVRVTRKAMNNIPGFLAWLQSRLPERLLRVEDAQILYGDGVSPNLKGILTAGNFVASAENGTVLVERIINDIALLEDTYEREATGITMRPKDYYSFFLNKAAGSGEYDLPQGVQFVNGILYILGVPVAPTTALTDGDYVVGDFQTGAQLLIQEGMRIEFFEQDGTNVRENKITVRIEESVALPVYGPNFFIKGVVPVA